MSDILCYQMLERENMRLSQIHDMDIITHCSTIWRIIVISPDTQCFVLPCCDTHDIWDEIGGYS